MEKARLVLVREKRALATPLELNKSVPPVNNATKSAGGEEREVRVIYLSVALFTPCVARRRGVQFHI